MGQIEIISTQIALSLLVAVVTSLLTVWLSLKRFYREKWWERKMDAYTRIIESLHHMKRDLEFDWEVLLHDRHPPESEKNAHYEKYRLAKAEILKSADVGEFLLSPEAAAELRSLETTLDAAGQTDAYFDMLDGSLVAVRESLTRMQKLARDDLNG